jgi:glucosylceramidase
MYTVKRVSLRYGIHFCFAAVFLWTNQVLAVVATDTIQAESYSAQSGVTLEVCSEGGQDVTSIQDGDNINFTEIDFGAGGIQCFEARVASYGNGGFIEVRLDSPSGTLVGTCEILPPTGGWQTWTNKACNVTGATGTHAVYLVFKGGVGTYPITDLFNLNWFTFHGTPDLATANWRQSTNAAKGVWKTPVALSDASGSNPDILYNPNDTNTFCQRVDGWGGAFNENGYHCISSLSPGLRAAVMRELYDPVEGCRFNVGRVPIGMSDFTVNKVYSLNETAGDYEMKNFSLKNDSAMNIPFVKAAMVANPNVMIYASPWTPPGWMKTNNSWQGGGNPTINQNAKTWTAYALYFSKFVKGWKQAGISVNIVFPQNEPGYNNSGHPSCSWTGTTLKNWVRDYLYPKFKADTIGTQIWMGTFNLSDYNNDIKPTLDDAQARTMITGIGTQRDGHGSMATASQNSYFKSLHYHGIETETNCWSGANSWTDAMNTFQQIYNHETANTNCYNMWNMILDANYNYVSWMTRAQNSMITITPASQKVTYNPEFYVMKHWSYYVRVGAVRLSFGKNSNNNLRHAAFRNPDGTIILVIQNSSSGTVTPLIQIGTKEFKPALAASSVNSFNIGGTEPARDWVPATSVTYMPPKRTVAPIRGPVGIYDMKGRLIKTVERAAIRENADGALWNRTDAGGRKAAPGMYLIINRASNTVVRKVMCQ